MSTTHIPRGMGKRSVVKSATFNIDNGAGATIDDVIYRTIGRTRIHSARIVYTTETAGTVAGANVKLGTSVNGADIAAATAYVNSSVVGATTGLALLLRDIPANTMVVARHTGIAATAAGQAFVELEIEYLDG